MPVSTPAKKKQRYVIEWKIEGSFEVEAESPEAATAAFDKAWGSPRGIMPERDGEVYSSEPVPCAS